MKHFKPFLIALIGFVIFAIVFFAGVGISIYKFNYEGRLARGASYLIPFPAARVGWHFISYSDFLFDLDTLSHFYNSQKEKGGLPIPSQEQTRKNVLERLIKNYFMEKMASEKKIVILEDEINNRYNQVSAENQGEENLKKMLKEYYNWTPENFKKRVIYYSLLDEKLTQAFGGEDELDKAVDEEGQKAVIKKYIE